MTKPIRAVVFDLDGTLIDSRADIAASANFALGFHGFPTHTDEVIGQFVGDGAKNLIRRAAAVDENDPRLSEILTTFLDHYARHCAVKTQWMPGALSALSGLSHLSLAILTNKPRQPTVGVLNALGYLDRFSVIIAGGDHAFLKPDARPLKEIALRLNTPITELIMVGDGPQDIECGRNAGAMTVGVKGGIASLERLVESRPDFTIDSLLELPRLVHEINHPTTP
jgi:2-phosphoglycolate phosphatase